MKAFAFVLVLLSLAAGFFILESNDILRAPWSARRETAVYSTLVETAESSMLETAQLHMKLIFPYDFIDGDVEPDWGLLRWYYDSFPEEYALKSSEAFTPDGVLPEPWAYADLYRICRESGLDPAGKGENFIVVSTLCRAGIPFDARSLDIDAHGENGESLSLSLPGAHITDIMIKDRSPGSDAGFPSVSMEPEEWSRLIREIDPLIAEAALKQGLLDTAEEAAELLLRELFEGAGYEVREIQFQD